MPPVTSAIERANYETELRPPGATLHYAAWAARSGTGGQLNAIRNWAVFVYFVAVLLAVGVLFAISAVPRDSAELFPNPSAGEVVQVVKWIWEAPLTSRQ
jgi:hypothetical protein